ncbi:MAG: hypothetical protein AUK44_03215 [Porphyromonadaceae bacterium CG2_30_38_12]|nr:MAG: hypothetical protein AUK44_03215 [Porphyromonadaceae bacterium CG2_30_38_12]
MDFTLEIYQKLLVSLKKNGYLFFTFEEYCNGKATGKYVILRHDVDLRAGHSVATARVEMELGIKASYFFRVIPESNQPDKIRAIVALGHEIGYHYEDLSIFGGHADKAIVHFENQLKYFRQFYPVKTICMHGSPTSKYDNRNIWKTYNYQDYGIIGEPYFDVNFDEVFYLTDTGRCWDGERYSVRDKVNSSFQQSFHSTVELIEAAKTGTLPAKIMITTHPQRWTNSLREWALEFVFQNLKNIVKRLIVRP